MEKLMASDSLQRREQATENWHNNRPRRQECLSAASDFCSYRWVVWIFGLDSGSLLLDQSFSAAQMRVKRHMGDRADDLLKGRVRLIK